MADSVAEITNYLWFVSIPVDRLDLQIRISQHLHLMLDDLKERGDIYPYGEPKAENPHSGFMWEVIVPVWNIRDKPSMLGSKVLGQLSLGQKVNQLSISDDKQWIQHSGAETGIMGWSGVKGLKKL